MLYGNWFINNNDTKQLECLILILRTHQGYILHGELGSASSWKSMNIGSTDFWNLRVCMLWKPQSLWKAINTEKIGRFKIRLLLSIWYLTLLICLENSTKLKNWPYWIFLNEMLGSSIELHVTRFFSAVTWEFIISK